LKGVAPSAEDLETEPLDSRAIIVFVVRIFLFLFLSGVLAAEQTVRLDPEFEKVPFDQWLNEKEQAHFHWKAGMLHPQLSFHQRLVSRAEIEVDGKDLQTRRGDGDMVFFVQITDREGTRYQSHSKVDLSKLDPQIKAANLEYSQLVFLTPGEYHLAVAILDTATSEHAVKQSKFRVDASDNDLLMKAWKDLPPVEFQGKAESPDSWFLPDIQGRLQWAPAVHSAVRMNILLNVAPSAMEPETWRPMTRIGRYGTYPPTGPSANGPVREHNGTGVEMAALIPTLKALTQTGSTAISENVALLDLSRRRTVFQQTDVTNVDWPRLKTSLGAASTASIDVHSLSDRSHDAQYFVSEVRRMVRNSDKGCVLVVLTNPVSFEKGEDLDQISTEALPSCHIFYIRYHPPVERLYQTGPQAIGRRGGRPGGGPMMPPDVHEAPDQLEGTLKPLNPKVFDVSLPDQITKAFVEIEKSLGR
jgi:hypothetical protein